MFDGGVLKSINQSLKDESLEYAGIEHRVRKNKSNILTGYDYNKILKAVLNLPLNPEKYMPFWEKRLQN